MQSVFQSVFLSDFHLTTLQLPQNKVLAADKGGQLAQNEEAEIQKV